MRNFSLLFLIFCAFVFSAHAQNEVWLHLAPRLGSQPFALNTPVSHPDGGYQMQFSRFELYVSDIKIIHDGGQETPCTDVYLLVRPATDSMFNLGQYSGIENVEAIRFSVGVPQPINHADPSLQPAGHPLALQDPSMHWGWAGGYRFAVMEGLAGENLGQGFEVHALGDNNYKSQTIAVSAQQATPDTKVIHLLADYTQAARNIDLSQGPIEHGTTGVPATLLFNFKNYVFSAQSTTQVVCPAFSGNFHVAPNPLKPGLTPQVYFHFPETGAYKLLVTNTLGQVMSQRDLDSGITSPVPLEGIPASGLYWVQLWKNGRLIATEKLVGLH
ncbi:MAG: hypothetical protein JNM22_12330 [Saprospiraceae bacterium]|nr:hypothetical protein [Saprospiraceae bacterium]